MVVVRSEDTLIELDETQIRIDATIAPAKALQALFDKIALVLERIAQAQEPLQAAIQPITAALADITGRVQNFLSAYGPALAQYAENIQRLPARMKDALLVIAREGWYLDNEIPLSDMWNIERMILCGEKGAADKWLIDHYSGRIDDIERALCERHRNRANLINMAFAAHRRREYALSIPVLLAQADGICDEYTDTSPFLRRNKEPETAAFVRNVPAKTFDVVLLQPLANSLPLTASRLGRNALEPGYLNRHSIMHGESTDYGTETNGLKAISFLSYVSSILWNSSDDQAYPL